MENSLKTELLDAWYPVSLDTSNGGFLSDFTDDWQPRGRQNKMIVTQTRHIWTASEAAKFYAGDEYLKIAKHGFDFIKEKMWDKKYGGFFMYRNTQGESSGGWFSGRSGKQAYGNAFAIYALSSYFRASGDSGALRLAQKTFHWLEKYSRDSQFGGYMDQLQRNGRWLCEEPPTAHSHNSICWKDQNSSIHLLEAFTALYSVWPDSLLHERLQELLILIRDTIAGDKGYLTLFLQQDWTPVSFKDSSEEFRQKKYYWDHVSFGHDVETAFLILEAAHALGHEADTTTLKIARKMTDHALANGWDDENGGFYDQGYYYKSSNSCAIIRDKKVWWVQAEGLNALLLMSQLFPNEPKYAAAFQKQWDYIKTNLIDHKHGGWYGEGLDKSPEYQKRPKASDWKINYHNSRALMNCIRMLRRN